MELLTVRIRKPEEVNLILGQSHFIKTAEDIYEALVTAVPGIRFGPAFCEASGPCLVRGEGNDAEMKKLALANAARIGCGHSFIIFLKNVFPINLLPAVKNVPEVCSIYCAGANPVEVVVAQTGQGRGIMGVIDGSSPKGVEKKKDAAARRALLRRLGYKCS